MKLFFLIFCIYLTHTIQAQIIGLPIQFNQYMRSYPQINPASSGSLSQLEINTGNQRHGGNWSSINTFYFNANLRIGKGHKPIELSEDPDQPEIQEEEAEPASVPSPSNFHVLGLNLTGDKEGSFLNRTGVYGIYAWHTQLKENLFLSGGASLGLKNYSVHDNYVNGGGSDFAPDGNVGIWIYNYDYHIGFSINQVFNGKLTPLNETTRLLPHYNLTGGKLWEIGPYFAVKPSFLIRMASKRPADIDLSMGAIFHNVLSATVAYHYKKGITSMLGLERITIGESNFKLMLSYHTPFVKFNRFNIYTYEITLNYLLKIKNKDRIIFQ